MNDKYIPNTKLVSTAMLSSILGFLNELNSATNISFYHLAFGINRYISTFSARTTCLPALP